MYVGDDEGDNRKNIKGWLRRWRGGVSYDENENVNLGDDEGDNRRYYTFTIHIFTFVITYSTLTSLLCLPVQKRSYFLFWRVT